MYTFLKKGSSPLGPEEGWDFALPRGRRIVRGPGHGFTKSCRCGPRGGRCRRRSPGCRRWSLCRQPGLRRRPAGRRGADGLTGRTGNPSCDSSNRPASGIQKRGAQRPRCRRSGRHCRRSIPARPLSEAYEQYRGARAGMWRFRSEMRVRAVLPACETMLLSRWPSPVGSASVAPESSVPT